MSECSVCKKAVACDWIEPPENCLDFVESALPLLTDTLYDFLHKYCEVILPGGARYFGWPLGVEEGCLVFECEHGKDEECVFLAVELDSGAVLYTREDHIGN